jgi:hypothetical protein
MVIYRANLFSNFWQCTSIYTNTVNNTRRHEQTLISRKLSEISVSDTGKSWRRFRVINTSASLY